MKTANSAAARFIARHDIGEGCGVVDAFPGSLLVRSEGVRDGAVWVTVEAIPDTLEAAREWLGY